jgi:acetyltransferase-like isoleucine patch superfamily enzyme
MSISDFLRILFRYKFDIFSSFTIARLRVKFPKTYISSRTHINFDNIGQLQIGENTDISDFTTLVAMNDPLNNVQNSSLIIGSNTYIGEYNNIRAGGGMIQIGDFCSISQHISIIASNHKFKKEELIRNQPWDLENNFVVIKDDVWIGANSIILPGVTIGKGAIIGAGSVVNKDIPDFAIAVGNPVRVIRYRE